ncbi:hypothetical protein ABGB17_13885 [Sphaerisporangium sp. B11E5]|uniref:hypothetical protein n=1 Tax=Sphaerisporangium sp. B11E5 TaxID=3153563 RepID=UPI00325C8552
MLLLAAQQSFSPEPEPAGAPVAPRSSRASTAGPGPPLTVDLVREERFGDGNSWVFPKAMTFTDQELAELNALPQYSEKQHEWLRRHGAVPPSLLHAKVVIRGNADRPVRVVGMRAEADCGPPLTGTYFESPGGGDDDSVVIGFDLDSPDPRGQEIVDSIEWRGDYFQKKTISLERDEEITVQIVGVTEKHYCEFVVVMEVLSDAALVRQRVDNHGRPFKVSAVVAHDDSGIPRVDYPAYGALYVGGLASPGTKGKWTRRDPRAYSGP